ncbi:MAG: hypothetical protein EON88_21775, partial [Brevundimonas sp.]
MAEDAVVGEIGPHICRFAWLDGVENGQPRFSGYAEMLVSSYENALAALRAFLGRSPDRRSDTLCLAVAAPVNGDVVTVTQSGWSM